MGLLIAIAIGGFFVLIVPAMALYAVARVRDHERELRRLTEGTVGRLTQRVFDLEATVRQLETRLSPDTSVTADRPSPDGTPAPKPVAEPASTVLLPRAPEPHPGVRAASAVPGTVHHPVAPAARVPDPVFVAADPAPSLARTPALDWESIIAGRWLNVIGTAALLLAVAFFLGYAFENEWIGPAGRVALGLVAGVALVGGSDHLFRRGRVYFYFAEGLAGLGGGVLYLSIYAAWAYYALLPQPVAFGGMVLVTAALMLLAAGRRAERIALVGVVGGFAAPLLLNTGTNQQIVLFAYVTALDLGAVALGRVRLWRLVSPAAFAGTQLIFWLWYATWWSPAALVPTAAFATLFFVLFAAASFDRLRVTGGRAPEHLALLLTNALVYLVALRAMLWPTHRWTLTLIVLALAAGHLLIARSVRRGGAAEAPLLRTASAGLALTFATLAIPLRLDGAWITIAWALEGAVLVWGGFAVRTWYLRAAGLVLFAIVGLRVLLFVPGALADRFLVNPRFLTLAATVACLAAATWFARGRQEEYVGREHVLYGTTGVAAAGLLLWAITADVWDVIGRYEQPLGLLPSQLRLLAIPFVWALFGGLLIVAGLARGVPGARWTGLPVVGVAVGALLVQPVRVETVLLNPRFGVFVTVLLVVFLVGYLARRAPGALAEEEWQLYRAIPVTLGLLLLVALSHEVWDLFAVMRTPGDVAYARSMGLSILWAAYAAGLIAIGVRRANPALRWMALLLFGIVVVKVFFFDLSVLDRGYRILSFFVLGVLLLGVSFLYSRRLAAVRGGSPP